MATDLHDHDKTVRLQRIQDAIDEGTRELGVVTGDGNSQQLTVKLAQYSAAIHFRRVSATVIKELSTDSEEYSVEVHGNARFVSDILSDACGRFMENEER